jgi:hypothetical protein
MDVFKLAFETTMVGVLAFLWLGIAVDLIYPPFFAELVPKVVGKNDALLGVAVLSLAYCIGSAIIPISSQLVNDEHWPVPEDAIRCLVLEDVNDQVDGIGRIELLKPYELDNDFNACHRTFFERFREKDPATNQRRVTWNKIRSGLRETFERMDAERRAEYVKTEIENDKKVGDILTKFQLMETQVLNQGTDKTERLRQLHERIVVLRGAVFNGFSFLLICVFAWIAPINGKAFPWKKRVPGTVLAVLLTAFSAVNGFADLAHFNISDIPALEGLLAVITIFGGILVFYGVKARPYLGKRIVLVAAFFAALSYGGWMWSEVIYDQQVISAYAVMQSPPKP